MRSLRIGVLGVVVAAAFGAVPAGSALAAENCTYQVDALPAPGGGVRSGEVTGTDGEQRFVGTAVAADGSEHGVLWQNGEAIDLGRWFNPVDVNRSGQVIGWGVNGVQLWQNGTMTALAKPAGSLGLAAEAINDTGLIVGFGTFSGSAGNRGLYWRAASPGVVHEIGSTADFLSDVGNDGTIIGGDRTGSVVHAVSGTTSGLATLPGVDAGQNSRADAISGRFVLGNGFLPGQPYRRLLWENGVPAPVDDSVRNVNGNGVLVGDEALNGGFTSRAYVQDGDVPTSLPLLPEHDQSRAVVVTESGVVGGVAVSVDLEGEHTVPVIWSCG